MNRQARALRQLEFGSAGPSLVTADGLGRLGRFGILPDELMQEILRIRKTEDAAPHDSAHVARLHRTRDAIDGVP